MRFSHFGKIGFGIDAYEKFLLNYQYFHNLEPHEQDQILGYEIMVWFCEGTSREKLDWFKTVSDKPVLTGTKGYCLCCFGMKWRS